MLPMMPVRNSTHLAIWLSLGVPGRVVPERLQIPKSADAQAPGIKWPGNCIQPKHILLYALNCLYITYNTNTR